VHFQTQFLIHPSWKIEYYLLGHIKFDIKFENIKWKPAELIVFPVLIVLLNNLNIFCDTLCTRFSFTN
jgi:hypothetical protein